MIIKTIWVLQLIILHCNIFLGNCFIHTDIVQAFFSHFSISHGNVLTCYSKKNQINLMKSLNKNKNVMLQCSNMKYVNLSDLLFTRYKRIGVVVDGDCPETSSIIIESGTHRFFDIKYYWLFFTSNKEYESMFFNANINIDSNIQVVTPTSNVLQHYDIDDFYNPANYRGGNFITKKLGMYSNLTGYKIKDLSDKFWQRRNLSGVTFKTMIVFHDPYPEPIDTYLKSEAHRDKNTYNRFHARLISYCSEHYHFRLNKTVSTVFGYPTPNGTMDGLVGELEKYSVDFGLSPLAIRKDRADVITYGRFTYNLRSAFLFRNPKSRNAFELFIRPLSSQVWYITLGLFMLSVLVLKWSSSGELETNQSSDSTWSFSFVCLIGAFCQQDYPGDYPYIFLGIIATPYLVCGKMGIFFTLFLTTIVYQFYSGSLVSSLLNTPLVLIKSVDDILDANFKIGLEDVRITKESLKITTDNASVRLYKKRVLGNEEQVYYKSSDGLSLMKKGQFAFHVELVKAYPFMKENFKQNEVCEITEVKMFKSIYCHAGYVKHSPFRDIIDVCLHRIAESGVLLKEYKFWHDNKPKCVYSYIISTGLSEFYPVLVCIGIGIIISTIILTLEYAYFILSENRNNS